MTPRDYLDSYRMAEAMNVSFVRRARTCVALAALAAIVASGCSESEADTERVIRPVRYTQVFAAGSARQRTFAGTARAASEQDLSFRVGGTLRRVTAKLGNRVRPSDTLAELDPSDFELKRQQAEASLAEARAQLRNAQASYERTLLLYENRSAARADVDAARASFEAAKAVVASSETGLRLAEQQVDYTRLIAPVAGTIARVDVDVNETVTAGQPVVVLASAGRPEVGVAIPEVFIGLIRPRSDVRVTVDAVPDSVFAATVTEIGVVSTGSGTFPVTVQLSTAADQVRSGMAAEVTFTVSGRAGTTADVILVPSEAVGQDRKGRFVFVLQQDSGDVTTAWRRAVEIGPLTAEGLEVLSGLEDGDLVVTAGIRSLVDGQVVRLLQSN